MLRRPVSRPDERLGICLEPAARLLLVVPEGQRFTRCQAHLKPAAVQLRDQFPQSKLLVSKRRRAPSPSDMAPSAELPEDESLAELPTPHELAQQRRQRELGFVKTRISSNEEAR